ncbi:glycoside hydrolase/phage tail family protein [Maritimibacter sp. UBA3975]|uniref:baseplate multidomain protein megatron n=1 Tax=Maritimibacter sp. UBA3975 TaxID=1946833 RepID=UPI000C08FDF3|nr:glycoside hydrolase/phage tail family protein [Maritimibacter sp. UBA3975]MAM61066.1 host specificity protein [Maritimibacter sp.]
MATIVLSAIGAGLGASVGGSVLGLSSVVIGRAVGAVAGRTIDNRLMGAGSEPVETGKVDRLRITGVSEGAPVGQIYGRFRTGGQVIWSGKVRENRTITEGEAQGSGKGFMAPKGPTVTEYSYSVSLAIALCEGEITHVGRIWADGKEVKPKHLTLRVYPGSEDQAPDPALEAAIGAGKTPAFRGTAYVVIENLDITQYGNRIPVFNFEVFRPEQPDEAPDLARGTKAVAMIPGCGEYALATEVVHFGGGPGRRKPANKHTPLGKPDFEASLSMLEGELPNCESVSLVVSWFGTDLRANHCELHPRVDQKDEDGVKMPWRVSGLDRENATRVSYDGGRAVYSGTPTDLSVFQAITRMKERGKAVTFYPFILMEQMGGNGLTDPWTGAGDQPNLPWRGRITASLAPGQTGSPDGTAAAEDDVAAFFGNAQPHHFIPVDGTVNYIGPYEWSYRRMILHYATICAQAGGVEAFLIGSELRGLTQIRAANNTFPVVEQLQALANDVRLILGPDVKISYAADWSEYFGYHPQDGSGDVFFHLDPLWSDPNIDFIGIDNYMPVADWREGEDHADAHWGSIYNLDYLKANVMGGEGYDWYYHAPEAREVQLRTPITDGAHGEPWVFRYKDIRSWWENEHHERIGGVRQAQPTDWEAGSKPIWFTEYGCAAIDKGANQPNKFLDPKSSESSLPRYSNGHRDDVMQMQYLRAVREFWEEPANNPTHPITRVRMIDMDRAHVWAWDARPFPWFPKRRGAWGDWENYDKGHWLNGRASNRSLASVVAEICERSGVTRYDTSRLYGLVRGYMVDQVTDARAALQPLMLAYGFEAAERGGQLEFFTRKGTPDGTLDPARFVATGEIDGDLEFSRAPEAEMIGRVRLNHTEAESAYDIRATEAVFPDEDTHAVSSSDLPMILTEPEARAITERWLAEARVARDRARFALAPSDLSWRAGDVVELETEEGTGHYRIDHVEQAGVQMVQAVRVEPGVLKPADGVASEIELAEFTPAVPVYPIFLDLPVLAGDVPAHLPRLAVTSDPWPGPVAVYSSASENGYSLNQVIRAPARIGVTESVLRWARPGLIDNGPALRVRLPQGTVSSAGVDGILNGSNLAAIGFGDPDGWEVFQFAHAELVEQDVYELSGRLRGQGGSDWAMPAEWPVGATVVFLDGSVTPLSLPLSARGLERHYRIGPASEPIDDDTYEQAAVTTYGVGLRPYVPAHLTVRAAGGDYSVDWVRRTRVDGDSWEGVDVPLGEDVESYVVRVIDGGTVKREVDVGSAGWTYTGAMQVADGVSAPFEVAVAQVSQSFGPGPFSRTTVE